MTDVSKPARHEPVLANVSKALVEGTQDAVDRTRRVNLRVFPDDSFARTVTAQCFNVGATDVTTFEPLARTGTFPTNSTASTEWQTDRLAIDGQTVSSEGEINDFVVALEPIASGEAGQCAVAGLLACPVYFSSDTEKWLATADILPGQQTLAARPEGTAHILHKDPTQLAQPAPVSVDCLISLDPPRNHIYMGRAVNFIPTEGAGPVSLYDNGTDTGLQIPQAVLDHMHSGEPISADKEVGVYWDWSAKLWRIFGAECEDTAASERAAGQLSDGPLTTGNPPYRQNATTTPAPWNVFDSTSNGHLSTANVTLNAPAATIQLPDVTNVLGDVYNYSLSGVLTPASNNNTYVIDITLNGTPIGSPVQVDGRQANSTLSFSFSGITLIPQQSAPVFGLLISTASGSDNFEWNGANFYLDRDTDF